MNFKKAWTSDDSNSWIYIYYFRSCNKNKPLLNMFNKALYKDQGDNTRAWSASLVFSCGSWVGFPELTGTLALPRTDPAF